MTEFDAGDVRLDHPEADGLMAETPQLWLYLPRLLWYPVRGYGLFVTVFFGCALWIISFAGMWGIPAAGIIFSWMGYYFMDVVQRTALGHAIPPALGTEVLFQGDRMRLLLMVAYVGVVLGLTMTFRQSNPPLSLLVLCGGLYLLPAYVAVLALEPDLPSILNPLSLLRFIWHTGVAYVFAALILAAVGFVGLRLAGQAAAISSDLLFVYGIIFVCHMVGYVAYHRHEALGIAVHVQKPTEETRAAAEQEQRLQILLAKLDKHLEAGEPKLARDALLAEAGADLPNPRGFHEDLFDALRIRRQDPLALVQGARLIRVLARDKRLERAVDILEQCLDLSRDFVPEPEALVGPLAETALRTRRAAVFTRLDTAVQSQRPQSEGALSLQFLKARVLVEQKQDVAALKLLAPLLIHTGHPWAARIQALQKALTALPQKA